MRLDNREGNGPVASASSFKKSFWGRRESTISGREINADEVMNYERRDDGYLYVVRAITALC